MSDRPWQLDAFDKTLKKRQKYQVLQRSIGKTQGKDCLLVTCGDNNGATNYYFRAHGGRWKWADVEGDSNEDMERFLGDPVVHLDPAAFPYADETFDVIVVIDVMEHLPDDKEFLNEVRRVTRPGGTFLVTVPTSNSRKLANRMKERAGMGLDFYGHTRLGYSVPELETAVSKVGFQPQLADTYIRPVTELLELGLNYGYVFMLSRKKSKTVTQRNDGAIGHPTSISPTTGNAFNAHSGAFRLYAMVYPILNAITKLDRLLGFTDGHAVLVRAVRGGNQSVKAEA